MKRTFGEQPTTAPPGNFRPIHFPQLARLDTGTKEGMISRKLTASGGNVRNLPRTVYAQETQDMGHFGSFAGASLWEVTIDDATGLVSGKGWVADDEAGHKLERMVVSKRLFHNSIDLGDIPHDGVRFIEHGDFWDDDFWLEVIFESWSLIATTLVGKPAFADAQAEMTDEIVASLCGLDTPLVVECDSYGFDGHTALEICASATSLPSWDHFHRPESYIPHKIIVGTKDEAGWIPVYGHLGQWNVPHVGYDGRLVYIPRPTNNYAEWNQPGPLTDRGQVEAGPIVLYGGHVSLKEAADDPRNAWADVRVIPGKHGPWMSGVVRPHIAEDDAQTYVARASRTSGHWKGGQLRMIISCNSEGFPINGVGHEPCEPDELVASFDPTPTAPQSIPVELFSFTELSQEAQDRVLKFVAGGNANKIREVVADAAATDAAIDAQPTFDIEFERAKRERALALEAADA